MRAFGRIRADTLTGMAFSNFIAFAIILTTAATLNKAGITSVATSAQAAEALRPIAGEFAFVVFALGIVGTGLLAVPVLAGSVAYATGEACKWPIGLSREPGKATAFYASLGASTVLGMALTLTPLDPIKALYWTAVINGLVAVPVMVVMMLMTAQQRVMGQFTVNGWLRWLGWAATCAMAVCALGMIVAWVVGAPANPKHREKQSPARRPGSLSEGERLLRRGDLAELRLEGLVSLSGEIGVKLA
jgi:Mn2+/Fe2+ NRAMP family transporter